MTMVPGSQPWETVDEPHLISPGSGPCRKTTPWPPGMNVERQPEAMEAPGVGSERTPPPPLPPRPGPWIRDDHVEPRLDIKKSNAHFIH